MATDRKIPARITTVDYVGVSTEESVRYRRRADQELMKLEQQVVRGGLDQGDRRVSIDTNVFVECSVRYELKEATIYIGRDIQEKLRMDPCYCCSPCLVAGLIIDVNAEPENPEDPEGPPVFEENEDYYAEVAVCQAGSSNMPMSVHVEEHRQAGGSFVRTERQLMGRNHGSPRILDVPFSDHSIYEAGESVWVLVMPLYGFTPYPGDYTACINQGMVAGGSIYEPYPTVTTNFVKSGGMSCQIALDEWMWDPEIHPYIGDIRFNPFRILPIRIKSCLS